MAETMVATGRTTTFKLVTPKQYVWARDIDIAASVASSDQDLLREGMWVLEKASSNAGPTEVKLFPASGTESAAPASIGIPRCLWADGDRYDVAWAGKAPCLMGHGWIGETKKFVSTSVDAGDYLAVAGGSDATGDYGKLKIWSTGLIAVARCLVIGSTWLTFQAIDPRKLD
jgi:hypothetical protein